MKHAPNKQNRMKQTPTQVAVLEEVNVTLTPKRTAILQLTCDMENVRHADSNTCIEISAAAQSSTAPPTNCPPQLTCQYFSPHDQGVHQEDLLLELTGEGLCEASFLTSIEHGEHDLTHDLLHLAVGGGGKGGEGRGGEGRGRGRGRGGKGSRGEREGEGEGKGGKGRGGEGRGVEGRRGKRSRKGQGRGGRGWEGEGQGRGEERRGEGKGVGGEDGGREGEGQGKVGK